MSPENGARVIAEAMSHVGEHYIHGGYGATPGKTDGCPCRPGMVNLIYQQMNPAKSGKPQSDMAVLAAQTLIRKDENDPGKYSVCAGSYTVKKGGHEISEFDPELKTFLDYFGKIDLRLGQFPSILMSPRRAYGPGPGGDIGGKLVWGEICVGARHFDCIGFISFCIWKAMGKVLQLEIKYWREPFNSGGQVFDMRAGQKPKELMDADVLIQADHHIGFVSRDGTLVQAEDTDLGVRATPGFSLDSPGNWTHLVRLPDYKPDPPPAPKPKK
ncbi:hypothetical protein [Arvimicrobium flavum]|uniref:hypothetical protein n=1 Tax=Arvimicrobium flavum TaxID=3393320 RepID=UPI00237B5E28|nr:hypothetical protein [Mesorhizobium shangrilense]